jgi:hypothetical protein
VQLYRFWTKIDWINETGKIVAMVRTYLTINFCALTEQKLDCCVMIELSSLMQRQPPEWASTIHFTTVGKKQRQDMGAALSGSDPHTVHTIIDLCGGRLENLDMPVQVVTQGTVGASSRGAGTMLEEHAYHWLPSLPDCLMHDKMR